MHSHKIESEGRHEDGMPYLVCECGRKFTYVVGISTSSPWQRHEEHAKRAARHPSNR